MTTNHQALRELAEKATPGPWVVDSDDYDNNGFLESLVCHIEGYALACTINISQENPAELRRANASFIAAANPQTILDLLDEVEALRVDAERYRYIRDVPWFGTGSPLERVIQHQRNAHWDQAIDAARHAQGDKA